MTLEEFKAKYPTASFVEDHGCWMAFIDGELTATWYQDGSTCEWT